LCGRLHSGDRLLKRLPSLLGHPVPVTQPARNRPSGTRINLDQDAAAVF
jgi:hypothetical protein